MKLLLKHSKMDPLTLTRNGSQQKKHQVLLGSVSFLRDIANESRLVYKFAMNLSLLESGVLGLVFRLSRNKELSFLSDSCRLMSHGKSSFRTGRLVVADSMLFRFARLLTSMFGCIDLNRL